MKVKAKTPVKYKGMPYATGQEFEVSKKDYEAHKSLLEPVEEKREPPKEPVKEPTKEPEKGLADLTVAQLKVLAAEKNIEGYDNMKKAELVEALEALEDDGDGGSGDPDNPPADPVAGQE